MSKIVTGNAFGAELCKALGLDNHYVFDLKLCIPVRGAATVEMKAFVTEAQSKSVIELMKTYELHERDESGSLVAIRGE